MLACASAHVGHSAAHVLGARYHIPHGAACAWSLPSTIRFIAGACPEKIAYVGTLLGVDFQGDETPDAIGFMTAQAYKAFCERIGMTSFAPEKPDETMLHELAHRIAHEPLASLSPIPVNEANILPLIHNLFNM